MKKERVYRKAIRVESLKNYRIMKKKSLKIDIVELAKKDLEKTKGGTRSAYDLDEVTQTGKKKTTEEMFK